MLVAIALGGLTLAGQEPLAIAKAHYASAAYEEALEALASARPSPSSRDAVEVAAYRAFCLFALGRTEEARASVESLVLIDPQFRPAEDQASPRVRAFFDEVRSPMLGDLAWRAYASARAAFERNDLPSAAREFTEVVRLLEQIPTPLDARLVDLGVLAGEFVDRVAQAQAQAQAREQARAEAEARAQTEAEAERAKAAAERPAVKPEEARAAEPPSAPDPDRIYADEDADVTKPAAISSPLPPWVPPAGASGQEFSGVVEVIIGRDGKAESASMRESIFPLYDSLLLSATRSWQFRPATKDGAPVRFRYRLAVRLGGS